jgi:hypothetical protein
VQQVAFERETSDKGSLFEAKELVSSSKQTMAFVSTLEV